MTPLAREQVADDGGADSIARNTLFSFAAQMTTATLTAVLTVFLVRELGPAEYGLFALATSIGAIVLIGADFGISASSARFTAERRGDRGDVAHLYVNALKLKALATGSVCLLLALLAGPIAGVYDRPGLAWPIRAIALATFGQSLLLMGSAFFTALGKVVVRLRVTATESFIEVGASIALVLLGAGAAGAAFGRAIGYVVGALVSIALALRLLARPRLEPLRPPDRQTVRIVGRYASALLVVDASYVMSSSANVLFLGAYIGTAASGIFQAPFRLITLLQYPGLSVANGVAPRLARTRGREPDVDALRRALRGLVMFQCVLLAPAILWAGPIADAILGDRYARSADVLAALSPYMLFAGVAPLLTNGVNYFGAARRRIPIALTTLALTLVGGVTLIPDHGVIGAAITTDVSYGFYTLGHLWLCHRVLALRIAPIAAALASSLLAAAAMAVVLASIGTRDVTPLDAAAGAVLGLAVYVGTLLATGAIRPRDVARLAAVLSRGRVGSGAVRRGPATVGVGVVYEIRWRARPSEGVFELVPLDAPAGDGRPEASSRGVAWAWQAPPPPSPQVRRAHRRLLRRLAKQGWEPCGHGEAWFAERFHRR